MQTDGSDSDGSRREGRDREGRSPCFEMDAVLEKPSVGASSADRQHTGSAELPIDSAGGPVEHRHASSAHRDRHCHHRPPPDASPTTFATASRPSLTTHKPPAQVESFNVGAKVLITFSTASGAKL